MSDARYGVSGRTRALTLAGVAVLHIAAIVALISAFGVDVVVRTASSLASFDVPLPPPPPPPPEPSPQAPEPRAAAAPAAPKATPRPRPSPKIVVAPKPAPVVAATGSAVRAGASAAGPGSAGGGQGNGIGSGGRGDGGGGGGMARRAAKIAGELKTKDFPRSGANERDGRFIVVRYAVGTDGRVRNCRVVQSSGSAEADAITCNLIERRFRYRPAEDASGRPVADDTGWKQWWWRPN
jgi:protein TonB